MIVNSHMHLGDDTVVNIDITEEEVIEGMNQDGVDASVLFPCPWPKDYKSIHDRIAAMQQKYPKRIFGLLNILPQVDEDTYFREVERCVKQYHFVGLKLHPTFMACPVGSPQARKIFVAAREFKIPVMIHSGKGGAWCLPCMFIPRAREFPDVTIICAHAGWNVYSEEALILAHECPNVILEPSWCGPQQIKQMVSELGAHRVMMGSDVVCNTASEIIKCKSIGLSTEELNLVLGGTAIEVFKLPL